MEKFDRINELVKKFRDDRDWSQFHNPKDLAISLSIEAVFNGRAVLKLRKITIRT